MNFAEHTKIRKEKFGTLVFDTLTEKILLLTQNIWLNLGFAGVFAILVLGVVLKTIPVLAIVAVTTLPWILKSIKSAEKSCDNPKAFLFVVNTIVVTHIVITLSLGISFLKGHIK